MNSPSMKPVSFRITNSEHSQLKDIASQLKIRDSELFRYAIENLIMELDWILEPEMDGIEFLLGILETDASLIPRLGLDQSRLEQIINTTLQSSTIQISNNDLSLVANLTTSEQKTLKKLQKYYADYDVSRSLSENLISYLKQKYIENNK